MDPECAGGLMRDGERERWEEARPRPAGRAGQEGALGLSQQFWPSDEGPLQWENFGFFPGSFAAAEDCDAP